MIVATTDGPVLIAVVCDGAGSAAHSDIGSLLAADTFIELVEVYLGQGGKVTDLNRETICQWIDDTAEALSVRAEANEHAVRDYACTLLAAIVAEEVAAFIQIGDGAMVVSHGQEDGWCYLFWPQHGEFANTTNFIVSANATEAVEFSLEPRRINEFAIFSDGIENLVLHHASRSVHDAFFNAMFPPVRNSDVNGWDQKLSDSLAKYLSSPAICERTDDDKTLVLATRLPHPTCVVAT